MGKGLDVSVICKQQKLPFKIPKQSNPNQDGSTSILLQAFFLSISLVVLIYILLTMTPAGFKMKYFSWEEATDLFKFQSDHFAGKVFNSLGARAHEEQNLLLCPPILSLSLAMILEGSRCQSGEELIVKMGWKHFSNDLVASNVARLVDKLKKLERRKEITFNFGAKLFVDKRLVVSNAYEIALQRKFQANVVKVDAENVSNLINEWVALKTHNRIREMVKAEVFPYEETKLFIVNVIFFSGDWMFAFHNHRTRNEKFILSNGQTKSVKTMHLEQKLKYGVYKKIRILELPYSDLETSMVILLPDKFTSLIEARKIVDENSHQIFRSVLRNLEKTMVSISIPKFKLDIKSDLKSALISLGIKRIFDASLCNLSGIGEDKNLCVSDLFTRSQIEINENGTVATQALGIQLSRRSNVEVDKVVDFRVNRPFLFFIKNKVTDLTLFIGQVADPTK